MRILCLTNYYPPYEIGGEEQSCYDVVQALRSCGHTVAVLTSTHGSRGRRQPEDGVYRRLHPEMELGSPWHPLRFFVTRRRREQATLALLQQAVTDLTPDVIFVWGMWNLPRALPALAEQLMPGRVLYRFGDYWPALPTQHELYWRTPGRSVPARLLKRALGRPALAQLEREKPLPALRLEHAYCISAAVRQELVRRGAPVEHARIIYNGVDINLFRPSSKETSLQEQKSHLSLLYAGRIVPEKGVQTAIEAVAHLVRDRGITQVSLALVGPAAPGYEAELRELVARERIEAHVSLRAPVAKERMPTLLHDFDVLLFPSIWPEPFGRILIEAMASGLAVVCTPVGGVPEIVTDEQDGLYFAPEDAAGLAMQIERLVRDPALRDRLAQAGRRTVEARFTLTRMIDQVESHLAKAAHALRPQDSEKASAP